VSERPAARCTSCGDTSEPMRVVHAGAGRDLAVCIGEDGARHEVDITIVGAVRPGEMLIVHAGAALGREAA